MNSQTTEQFAAFASTYAELADHALLKAESSAKAGDMHDVALRLPSLVAFVDSFSSLRGDNDSFDDVRPAGISGTLYGQEDALVKRVVELARLVEASDESTFYHENLQDYFLRRGTAKAV